MSEAVSARASVQTEAFLRELSFRCTLCPRACGAVRSMDSGNGFCHSPAVPMLVRAAAHFGEEPCISGEKGSGTLFFTGCHLRCVYCQNHRIARGGIRGWPADEAVLTQAVDGLLEQGVHNISFVSATHFSRPIARFLEKHPLPVPVVWNCSGYEGTEQLKELEGLVQIYLPDFKYADEALGRKLSLAPAYPETALAALKEMLRQTGPCEFGTDGLLKQGVLVRHLILPGYIENTLRVIDLLEDRFPPHAFLFSLLSQYTPIRALTESGALDAFPSLKRPLSTEEYDRVWSYLSFSSLEDGYVQDLDSCTEEAVPAFDGTGVPQSENVQNPLQFL